MYIAIENTTHRKSYVIFIQIYMYLQIIVREMHPESSYPECYHGFVLMSIAEVRGIPNLIMIKGNVI